MFASELSPLLCLNDSVWLYIDSVTGGQGTQTYFWSNSQNQSDSIFGTESLYNVIVEDTLFGCIDSFEVDIQVEYEIFDFVSINNVSCYGQSTGSISIDSLKTESNFFNIFMVSTWRRSSSIWSRFFI